MNRRLTNLIALVVLVAWATSFLCDIVLPNYDPPATVHALMVMVVGAALVPKPKSPPKENE